MNTSKYILSIMVFIAVSLCSVAQASGQQSGIYGAASITAISDRVGPVLTREGDDEQENPEEEEETEPELL